MTIQLGFLSLLVVALWRSSHAELENFMLLAGPHTSSHTSLSRFSEEDDVFGCRSILPQQSREYFPSLQDRGVSHFTVALSWPRLLPTGDPEHPHTQTLICYKTLVRQLTHSGIKPLLVLHRSTVPEPFRSRYGTWENPKLVRLFERYAEFVLAVFGDHVDTFITFSHVHELHETELQNTLQAHADVYKLYHDLLKEINLSLAIRANDVSSIFQKREDLKANVDFLSVHLVYNCGMKTDLPKELRKLKISSSQQSMLIYQLTLNNCEQQEDNFQPLISLLHVLQEKELQIRGCDITQLFGQQVEEEKPQRLQSESSKPKPNQRSASAFSYQKVWEKFKDESQSERDHFLSGSFPEAFQWSVSSESFQVEGGWAEHGKGETIWDRFSHDGQVYSNQTTDLACDSFHKVNYDTYLLRGMFLSKYQFSISWARIFPSGRKDSLVEKGAMYYDQMINTLQRSGIEPTVTLHHWDLPQALQEQGGWTNVSIVEAFKEFSDFCFSRYGDRVKTWITFGSPGDVSHFGYGTGEHPPSIKDPVVASYEVTHNILKSHAEAWHVYDEKYRKLQGGKVGIALHSEWAEPKNPSSARDIEAAERYLNFMLGWFAHPIFVDGDYPAVLRDQIETKKAECGRELARLPVFTEAEKQRIRGTADFFGLNHHTSRLISESLNSCEAGPSNVGDFQASFDPLWPSTASEKIQSVPWGLRRLLNYISLEYTSTTKVPIYITGNGMPTAYNIGLIDDTQRVDYLKTYINEAMKAVLLDKVALQRFTVKSLMDGFEGPQGYSHRFGLHYVDFNDPDRPRTPKESAHFYSNVIERNGFPPVNLRKQIEGNKMKSIKRPHLPSSEVPSKSKIVWEKFSSQTKFERKLYHYGTFPVNFQWGVSSSAYQVEGGWNADGKGPSVWDVFAQKPGNIPNNDNGNIACDSYKKVEEDLYMLRALKVKIYKFSLSWSRIFPNGHKSSLNQKGVDYYNRLIDSLIANNITPIVTLYHLDLPQVLQETNGWENPDMIGIFNEYCSFCYETFGDRVKFWITINEPHTIAWLGYGLGQIPPNVKKPGDAPYRVAHNLIKAHARAYHTYDEKYRATQGGLVSISLNTEWAEPLDVSVPREIEAADRALQFQIGWFAHPIFKNGDYPDAMKWHVGNKSELQGLKESRLPSFTDEEKSYIQATADVFCINTYTTKVVQHVTSRLNVESYQNDMDVEKSEADGSESTAVKEQKAFAWGLRRLLSWLKEEYGDPEIYITESGEATGTAVTVDDTDRIFYLKTYVNEVLKAHNLDGVRVKGYAVSSLMDSFEWLNGYKVSYGLHHVNFKNPFRPRTPKRSAQMFFEIIKDNGFPMPEEERMMHGHFREGFVWSTATAAYQIEGAWRADGKGLSIWDTFAHTALKISNDENGDLACDSYHRFREDVENLKTLRVNHYRFSISWPRIMPDGTNRTINEAGLNYYHELVDALLAANIKPQVTLYHWDLPQALQDVGGWENHTVVDRFRDYADVLFNSLGDKVRFWITINEPYNVAMVGHGYGSAAPGISFRPGTAPYIVAHNLIKAHAEAWHLYNDKYRARQGGIVGITINSDWAEPRNPYKQEDVDAARRVVQFQLGWFAHPIFKGDYSDLMKNIVRERSLAAGRPESRLPEFSPAEVARIKGTHDYFGFNHYTTVLAYNYDYKNLQHYDADRGAGTVADRSWLDSGSFWLKVTPPGFRKILKFIKEEYGDPPVYITENGVSERGPVNLNDVQRIHYYEHYVNQALKAHLLDGVDIRGYAAWTLMDNLEWATGYDERFGLFYVNRSDPSLTRIPKKSVWSYATLANCNGFIDPAEGPYDCLVFQPEDDGNTGTTSSPAPDEEDVSIHFLGLDISGPDAELALNLLFSLSVIAAVALVLMGYGLFRTKKAAKRSRF